MARSPSLRIGDILVSVGGIAVLGFSFAPFVQYSGAIQEILPADATGWFSAWSTEIFMVPLTTFVVVAAVLAVAGVWTRFGMRRDPNVAGFRLTQLEVGLALFGFMVLLGMAMSDKYLFFGSSRDEELRNVAAGDLGRLEVGWGAVLMVLGALIALVGAVLNHLQVGPSLAIGTSPSAQQPQHPQSPPPPQPPQQQPPQQQPPQQQPPQQQPPQ